jgi:hypothetical protein
VCSARERERERERDREREGERERERESSEGGIAGRQASLVERVARLLTTCDLHMFDGQSWEGS